MLKKLSLAAAALAMGATALVPVTPASAQRYERQYRGDYDRGYGDRGYGDRGYDNRSYDRRGYDSNRGYRGDRRDYRRSNRDRGCGNGEGGTIIGAIAGGLLGNSVAGRGDRTLGAVLGAGAGALAGRAIDRSDDPRYCRR